MVSFAIFLSLWIVTPDNTDRHFEKTWRFLGDPSKQLSPRNWVVCNVRLYRDEGCSVAMNVTEDDGVGVSSSNAEIPIQVRNTSGA